MFDNDAFDKSMSEMLMELVYVSDKSIREVEEDLEKLYKERGSYESSYEELVDYYSSMGK